MLCTEAAENSALMSSDENEVHKVALGALEAVLKATGASHGSIVALSDGEPVVLSEEASATLAPGEFRVKPTSEVIAQVERERRAVYFESAAGTDKAAETRCSIAIPIVAGARMTGVLSISNCLGGKPLSEGLVSLLTSLGTVLGSAIESASLAQELRRHTSVKDCLLATGQALSSWHDETNLIDASFRGIRSIFGDVYTTLRELDHKTGELVLRASTGMSEEQVERGRCVRPEGTLLGVALTTGQPVAIEDTMACNDKIVLHAYASAMRSIAVAPFTLRDEYSGTLKVYCPLPRRWTRSDLEYLQVLANQIGMALENARFYESIRARYWDTLKCLVVALEEKDTYTEGHASRVAESAMLCASALRLSDEQREHLEMAALLHDIGKVTVPDGILMKPAFLEPAEWDLMKRHPAVGAKILAVAGFPPGVVEAVRYHHERWSGGGYPDGLAGQDIPLLARIIGVADAFDAMTSDRPYRPKYAIREAATKLRRAAGQHFDPDVVDALLETRVEAIERVSRS